MKRLLSIVGVAAATLALAACSSAEKQKQFQAESRFSVQRVGSDDADIASFDVYVVTDKERACDLIVVEGHGTAVVPRPGNPDTCN